MGLDLSNDYEKAKSKISAYQTTIESKKNNAIKAELIVSRMNEYLKNILKVYKNYMNAEYNYIYSDEYASYVLDEKVFNVLIDKNGEQVEVIDIDDSL